MNKTKKSFLSYKMEDKKSKNILVVNGVLHGHFTGSVELVRELVSIGHNVTCYVLKN